MAMQAASDDIQAIHERLEERILARDQKGASDAYYDLIREGRSFEEIALAAVRIHGPLTHVPYHERIDDGYVNFVNNDHCLLSARAAIHLARLVPAEYQALPLAQTIWYIPTGLDIWNQKILKAPGHYARGYEMPPGPPPEPVVHWPDAEPLREPGTPDERFGHWQTLVHRGEVIPAYRIFRGFYEEPENRERALSELCFAGLIDVQDRMLNNRSYTTGHKAYRARATVELARLVGYENSHPIIYAGALDIAVGPRWYSTYELACNAVKIFIEGQTLSAVPYGGTAEEERALYANTDAPSAEEAERLITAILREPEPGYLEVLADLLKAGKSLVHLIDTIQVGAARLVLETGAPMNFSMAQHCYEYCNTLRWFYDTFEHPQRVKLLFLAASFLNRAAHHQAHIPGNGPVEIQAPAEAAGMDAEAILDRIEDAVLGLDPEGSRNWTQAYLDSGADRDALVARLALAGSKIGNDPHNQELAQITLEDYLRSTSPSRDIFLLANAHHGAGHRKYGNHLSCWERFAEAFGLAS